MSDTGPVIRGYRPSRVADSQPEGFEGESVRMANLEKYILRAQAGLPIFEDSDDARFFKAIGRVHRRRSVR